MKIGEGLYSFTAKDTDHGTLVLTQKGRPKLGDQGITSDDIVLVTTVQDAKALRKALKKFVEGRTKEITHEAR